MRHYSASLLLFSPGKHHVEIRCRHRGRPIRFLALVSNMRLVQSTPYGVLCIRVFHHLSHDRRTCRMSIAGDQTAGKRQHCFCPSMLSHGVWSRKYKVRISPEATSKITNRCPIPRIASYALRSQDGTSSSGGWPFASHSRYSMDARSAAGGWVWREMIWQLD